MPFLYLRGRTIRYVHLPACLEPAAMLDSHRRRIREAVTANRKEMLSQHRLVKPTKGVQDDEPASGDEAAMDVEQSMGA